MRFWIALLALAVCIVPASAQDLTSEYTKHDPDGDCLVIGSSVEDGEGDWSDIVCPGYGGYPYVIRYGDGRESVTYGFATDSGMATFAPFNYGNDTVEWRVRVTEATKRPVAAIQRWYLANAEGAWTTQILVVSRVGQPGDAAGACVVGYVAAGDGAPANERARVVADKAEAFDCSDDEPSVETAIAGFVPPRE
jgi:hypothetical protein